MLTEKNIRNIFIYAAPMVSSFGLNLLTLPILTRLLSPGEFGIMTLAWAFPTLAVGIITCGITSSVQRYYFEYKADQAKLDALMFSSQVFLYVIMVVSACVVFLLRGPISRLTMLSDQYDHAVFVAFLSTYLGQVISFYLTLYQNREQAGVYASATILQALLNTLTGLVLVWKFDLSYLGMIYGSLIGNFLVSSALLVHFNRNAGMRFNFPVLRDALTYGLQVVPKSLTGFINRFFDKYMLNNILSLSAVGIYNLGQTVGNAMFSLMSTVWSSFQPVYYREVFEQGAEGSVNAGRIFTIFAYLALFPLLMLMLFAQEIVPLLAPPEYSAAIDVMIILLGGMASQVFGMYVGVQYAVSKKAYWIFPVTVAGTLVNIVANILLIPRYGLKGAAIATVCMLVTVNFSLTIIGQKLHHLKYEWKAIISLFVLVALSAVAALSLRTYPISVVIVYGIKLSLVALFILLGVKTKIITRQSFTMISSVLLTFRKGDAS